MKSPGFLIFAMVGALVLQGCAATGDVKPAPRAEAPVRPPQGAVMFSAADTATKAGFEEAAAEIRKEIAPGGKWANTTDAERKSIDADLDRMQALFDQFGSVAGMDQPARLELFNSQEAINAILTQRDDQRIICRKINISGSLLPVTHCMTNAQVKQQALDTQSAYQGLKSQLDQTPDHIVPAGSRP